MSTLLDGASLFIHNWRLTMGILIFIAIVLIPICPRLKSDSQSASTLTVFFIICFILVSLLVRLAFVSKAILPSYFDSAQHYMTIKNILSNGSLHVFESFRMNYYHVGFHFITAFFASIFQAEITSVMLILGQVILTVLPLLLFLLIKDLTNSDQAGIFAMALSAFGWYMPAHAVDWGKYPALMSLGMILLVVRQAKDLFHGQKRMMSYGILGLSIFVATFIHSRSVVVLGVVGVAWKLSMWWNNLAQVQKRYFFFFLLVTLMAGSVIIQQHEIMTLLFDPYLVEGIWTTSIVFLLSVFAYRSFPKLTFIITLAVILLLISLYIPIADMIPGRTQLTLLDRPYVEMLLFLPLSLLGGLGLAGLEKVVEKSIQRYIVLLGVGIVLLYAIANYEFYPSKCCVIAGNDDVAAMAWIENQLPTKARIGIASTELRVVAADVSEGDVGADAGIWITPLIEWSTILLPFDSEFDQPEIFDALCTNKIDYLFVGELGQTFDLTRLDSRPAWYRPLLSMPRTRVYEVVGCDV